MTQTLAHLSDLHLGKSSAQDAVAACVCRQLLELEVSHVVVTGDVTHRGRRRELALFERLFAPLLSEDRLTIVPGNHDRVGEDAGEALMGGHRVAITRGPGLHLVRIDSTGPHNRSLLASHGALCHEVLSQVEQALRDASAGALTALLLHHHVLPLPEESWGERLATLLGWPWASELPLGLTLLEAAQGRCDLVLHGHRHVPRAFVMQGGSSRPLGLYNAGSSTELAAFRLFRHARGRLLAPPEWVHVPADARPISNTGPAVAVRVTGEPVPAE